MSVDPSLRSGKALPSPFRVHWQLRPDLDFLNHGSFGASPSVVMAAQRAWIEQLESDPIEFLAPERTLLGKLDEVRRRIAELVNASPRDLVFVRNATEGVNAVVRSFPWRLGDEVVITSHGYNACNNAVRFAAERAGANVVVAAVPFPIRSEGQVIDAVIAALSERTRLLVVDHVTSPTGLVFPVQSLVTVARERGVRILIDGAHAPGMVPLDLQSLGADYYTANHHKWLCGPKTSGFLLVRPEWQPEVRPTIVSHGANKEGYGDSRFLAEFNWVGTYDPSPILAMPVAIDFLESLLPTGLPGLMASNRTLALAGRTRLLQELSLGEPAPAEMLGSLASIPLPGGTTWTAESAMRLQRALYKEDRIEVPIFPLGDQQWCLRVSAQAYNDAGQYDRLATALRKRLWSQR